MTKAQENVVEMIRRNYVAAMHGERFVNEYEIKEYDVKPLDFGNTISMVIESGMIGDEGTMAECLCRNRIHIFIGSKGGITYCNRKGTMKRGNKRLLFSIYYDQKH